MNVDDYTKELVTDLRLALDYSNRGSTRLCKNSGAGANAASRVDMAFVASDHLKELVWSPRKGLSIKCTNCSAAAEESRRMLTEGMGSKATSANQVDEVLVVTAVTSSMSFGVTCHSSYNPVNKGSRCKSSPCLKEVWEHPASPVKSMPKVSSRKRSFHIINKEKYLYPREKKHQPLLCIASNIDGVNQQATSIPEEYQHGRAFKKQELSADDDVSVFNGKSYRREDSHTESKINDYQRKGKAKVLSDTNVEHDEEESRGSIKSCSSAGSFCSRQRKRNLGHDFTNESKRIKATVQQSPLPLSLVNGSSSFINWISNMTKGINKANKDGTACLALALAPSRPRNENRQLEIVPHGNNDKYPYQRTGFENIFRSIYCTSLPVQGNAKTDYCHQNAEPFDACMDNSMVDVLPLSMHEMTSSSCKGDQSSGNGERQMKLRKVLSKSSLDKCGTQNNDSSRPKINAGSTNVSDPLQSSWITRFCPKSPVPKSVSDNPAQMLLIDNQTMNSNINIFRSGEVSKVVHGKGELNEDLNKHAGGQGDVVASDSDASIGPKRDTKFRSITQTSDCNIDHILITEKQKSSEAMSSMFARRLDAIKHMTLASLTGNASGVGTTCFYCGKKGHSLRNCSEFTGNKLEGVLDSIGFPDSSENTPCLCIRCFQLGHWATDCPMTPCNVTDCEPLAIPNNDLLETPGDRSNEELLVENKDIPMANILSIPCDQNNSESDPELYKLYGNSAPVKHMFEDSAAAPSSRSVIGQGLDTLKEYFDVVRLLRLSRREILKLVDSQMELSNLEGYFLRVRLGTQESGHGATGYHVAYIDGIESEESHQGSKFILPVNTGCIKISVGSQSISNQEFLEDELMVWWSDAVKNGNNLPTLEELNDKLLLLNKLRL